MLIVIKMITCAHVCKDLSLGLYSVNFTQCIYAVVLSFMAASDPFLSLPQ